MDVVQKDFDTPAGTLEGIQVDCPWFSILWAAGAKGMVACGAINAEACDKFGVACAIARSSADNPIRTLDDLVARDVKALNAAARALGIREGMPVRDAMALLA